MWPFSQGCLPTVNFSVYGGCVFHGTLSQLLPRINAARCGQRRHWCVIAQWRKDGLCSLSVSLALPHICLQCFFLAGDSLLVPKLLWEKVFDSSSPCCFSEPSGAPVRPAEFCVKYGAVSLLWLPPKGPLSPSPPPRPGCGSFHPREMEIPSARPHTRQHYRTSRKSKTLLAHLHFT